MINVLIVEDSPVIRDHLIYILEADSAIRIAGTVGSGEEALESVQRHPPDVVLMDIHLPGIDGFETTRRIMATHPVPIVVCTASERFDDVHTAMRALEAGALAVTKKPSGVGDANADSEAAIVVATIKTMSEVKLVRRFHGAATTPATPVIAKPALYEGVGDGAAVVAIGASTGGPPALLQVLSGLSTAFPAPVLVVQHIAHGFTVGFTEWLASASGMPVRVGQGGEIPLPGHVYVAPDNLHLTVGLRGELQTTGEAPHNGLRPSVGVLFRSVAKRYGRRSVGVLLTGMGRDGAEELKLMADGGALTVAQDEESCVVFGMPAEAIKLGAARYVLPPQKIADLLITAVRSGVR